VFATAIFARGKTESDRPPAGGVHRSCCYREFMERRGHDLKRLDLWCSFDHPFRDVQHITGERPPYYQLIRFMVMRGLCVGSGVATHQLIWLKTEYFCSCAVRNVWVNEDDLLG
jgi:hypothetical protein